MTDKYEALFQAYKNYVESKSKYGIKVVKYNTSTSTYFPLVTFVLSNNSDSDSNSLYNIDYFEDYYFTVTSYSKDKKINGVKVSFQVIDKEFEQLTSEFFRKINMKKTFNQPKPNLDTSIFRRIMQFEGRIGNRGNILRR